MFTVQAVALNHRIPSFAYALEERFHINVNKQKLYDSDFRSAAWLKDVKQYLWEEAGGVRFTAVLFDEHRRMEREFVLGDFARRFLTITRGQKLAYVVDARYDQDNEARSSRSPNTQTSSANRPISTSMRKSPRSLSPDGQTGRHHGAQSRGAGSSCFISRRAIRDRAK